MQQLLSTIKVQYLSSMVHGLNLKYMTFKSGEGGQREEKEGSQVLDQTF